MLALKRLPEKHTLIKLAAQTNKRTQILIQTGRGKRQGGTNNDMCSASRGVDPYGTGGTCPPPIFITPPVRHIAHNISSKTENS